MKPKILAMCGSIRKDSRNWYALTEVAKIIEGKGGEVTILKREEYDLPLYNGDLEKKGLPKKVERLKKICKEHDALLIAAPEYNSGITPLLKNIIDWLSRKGTDKTAKEAFNNKVAAVISVSDGKLGGLRGQYHTRYILQNLNILIIPEIATIALENKGDPLPERSMQKINNMCEKLIKVTNALK